MTVSCKSYEQRADRCYSKIFITFALIILVLMLRNSFFAHPSVDDFSINMAIGSYGGVLGAFVDYYNSWGGRFSASIIMLMFVKYFDVVHSFYIFSSLSVLLGAYSFFYFLGSFGNFYTKERLRELSVCVFLLFVASLSTVPQAFYWLSGGVTYLLGPAFLLLLLGRLLRLSQGKDAATGKINIGISFIFAFLLAGFSEVLSITTVAIFFICTSALYILLKFGYPVRAKEGKHVLPSEISAHQRAIFRHWLYSLLGICTGAYFLLTAPGNGVRLGVLVTNVRQKYTHLGEMSFVVEKGFVSGTNYIFEVLPMLFALSAFPIFLTRLNSIFSQIHCSLLKLNKAVIILCLVGLMIVVICPFFVSYYSLHGYPGQRSLIISNAVLASSFPFVFVCLARLFGLDENIYSRLFRTRMQKSMLILLFIFGAYNSNLKKIILDSLWEASAYNQELKERYRYIYQQKAKGVFNITVPALVNCPETICFGDIESVVDNFKNRGCAHYFGLKAIKTESHASVR